MTTLPPEKKGLLSTSKDTEETSFITGETSGRVLTAKDMATLEVEKDFPNLDRNQLDLRYRTVTRHGTAVRAIIEVKMKHRDKWYPLYTKTRGGYRENFKQWPSKRNQISSRPF